MPETELTEGRLTEIASRLQVPADRPRGSSWSLCVEHRDEIERLVRSDIRLTKVRKLLLRNGVEVPYPTLHRFAVAELGFGRRATTIAVLDGEPGDELQLDTGWVGSLVPDAQGRRRRFRAWIFTAVRCRHRFVYPCLRETTESAIEACEAAWAFYGGIFRTLLPDNTKAIVDAPDPVHPRINERFLEYSQARGFHVDPARVRHPRDKARVERAVQTVRDDGFAGERIADIEQARTHIARWCHDEYGQRRHSTTQRLPLEHFQSEELPALLPPPLEAYDIPLWASPKVARDQYAQVARALYSLPTRFVGKILRARANRSTVRFYDGAVLVKTHPRQAPGGRSTDPNDFPEDKRVYAHRDLAFLQAQAQAQGEWVGRFAAALLAAPLPWRRMRAVYQLRRLTRKYGPQRTDEACRIALAADMVDVRRLERVLQAAPITDVQPPGAVVVPIARFLRPKEQYRLQFTPHEEESR